MIEQIHERFAHKNIQAFQSQLWALDDHYNIGIAHEVIRLCQLIQPKYRDAFKETDWLIQEANQKLASISIHHASCLPLEEALAHITKIKSLGVLYLPAFLASNLILTSYDHNKFEQYKALTLVCVARLAFIGQHKSRIENICNDVRLFSKGGRENLAAYMPDIQMLSFPQLVAAFQDLVNEENNPDLPPPSIVNQLNHYRRPYEASLSFTEGYSRHSNATSFNRYSQLETSETKFLEGDNGDSLIELREISSHPTVSKHIWQTEDTSSDVARTFSIVSTQSTQSNDYAANALHARAINARIQRKEMSLACDIANLTKFEVGTVINYCTTSIQARDCNKNHAKALLLMLFTGNPFHLVKKLKAKRNNKNQLIGFQRRHKVPSQIQRSELLPLLSKSHPSFWLPLPDMMSNNLASLTFRDVTEEQLKSIIKHINQRHSARITLTKITTYLQQLFAHENVDPIYTALIKGSAINETPALYYTRFSAEQLTKHYSHYLQYLSRFCPLNNRIFTVFKEMPKVEFYGSSLYFDDSLMTILFSSLYKKIRVSIHHNGITDTNTHNLITLYTQLVLALSSGYRPVTGWFGKREHLNLGTGDYWISDKESGLGDNSRVIVLPQKMADLLKHYLDLCSTLAVLHSNVTPRLSTRYQHTLNSDEHLFFYLDKEQIVECTPSSYSKQIDSIFPIQPNWARHQIRTLLIHKEIDPALIAAWMGHYNQSKRALHSYSNLNRKHYHQIAAVLNEYIENIGIEVSQWEK